MLYLSPVLALAIAGCGGSGKTTTVVIESGSGQQVSGVRSADLSAESDARNLVSWVESCASDSATLDYTACDSADELGDTGLSIGSGPRQVEVLNPTAHTYEVVSHSASGNTFRVAKQPNGTYARTCDDQAAGGGCVGGTW